MGGLPVESDRRRFRIEMENFIGCIKDLVIDEQSIDFDRVVLNSGTEIGCRELSQASCSRRPCKNVEGGGQCRSLWGGYACECGEKHGGQNCTDGKFDRFFIDF